MLIEKNNKVHGNKNESFLLVIMIIEMILSIHFLYHVALNKEFCKISLARRSSDLIESWQSVVF
jgi:hypothetical protein